MTDKQIKSGFHTKIVCMLCITDTHSNSISYKKN